MEYSINPFIRLKIYVVNGNSELVMKGMQKLIIVFNKQEITDYSQFTEKLNEIYQDYGIIDKITDKEGFKIMEFNNLHINNIWNYLKDNDIIHVSLINSKNKSSQLKNDNYKSKNINENNNSKSYSNKIKNHSNNSSLDYSLSNKSIKNQNKNIIVKKFINLESSSSSDSLLRKKKRIKEFSSSYSSSSSSSPISNSNSKNSIKKSKKEDKMPKVQKEINNNNINCNNNFKLKNSLENYDKNNNQFIGQKRKIKFPKKEFVKYNLPIIY